MTNSNGDNFPNDPMAETEFGSEVRPTGAERVQEGARKISQAATEGWEQTRRGATAARERTEFFLRENPVPTIVGALALGLAIGLAIRYASRAEPEPATFRRALKNVDLGSFSPMPFLWPFFRRAKRHYDESAEVVSDAVREGIDRVRDVDVDRYVKPLRKRWKNWAQ